ncbi:MAG: ECF transporter S component [Firmicutes bacterium]|jgi:uncharacterized membrane protein|nr:ECF transporter S component [Bacillota bacterium]
MSKVRILSVYGLFTALVTLSTAMLKIPGPTGYYHLGDIVIYTAASLLGGLPAAAIAAVGSALADLWTGYTAWIPWTFFIKGAAGFVAGAVPRKYGKGFRVHAMIAGAFLITLGYGLATGIMVDPRAALGETVGNLLQSAVGVLGAVALLPAVERALARRFPLQ